MFAKLLLIFSLLFAVKTTPTPTPHQIGTIPSPAVVQKNCPVGFVLVPGSTLYKTTDFCVMKYDAKCADKSDLTKGLEPSVGSKCTAEGTYKNNGLNCACTGTRQIVSTASGFPLTFIPETSSDQTNAKSYCEQQSWHLITNDEWMTIARNVETVTNNWCDKNGLNCGATPGAEGKVLANGHYDSNPNKALVAGNNDVPCFATTADGSNLCGHPSSQKRTLALTNGNIIWDFAGNVWQWVDFTVARKDQPKSKANGILDHGWLKSDFAPGSLPSVITDNGTGNINYDVFRPSNPNWNANNGVGRIYHYVAPNDTDSTLYTFIRGGNWRHGADDGAFTVHMSPVPSKQNIDDVGFRCAVNPT